MHAKIEQLQKFYNGLNIQTIETLPNIYHPSVVFQDPAHRIEGLPSLQDYFTQLYQNLIFIKFDFTRTLVVDEQACIQWIMHFEHPKLDRGQRRTLQGCSWLSFHNDHIIHHQDHFDMGEMLYEGLPVLGLIIKTIKNQLGQK